MCGDVEGVNFLEQFSDPALDNFNADDDVFVFAGNDSSIHVPFPQIGRTPVSDLYTYQAHKNYRPHYEKGRIRPGMETLPFGYRLPPAPQNDDGQPEHRRNENDQ